MRYVLMFLVFILVGCGITKPADDDYTDKHYTNHGSAIIQNHKGDSLSGFYIKIAGVESTISGTNGIVAFDNNILTPNISYIIDVYKVTTSNIYSSLVTTYNAYSMMNIYVDYISL